MPGAISTSVNPSGLRAKTATFGDKQHVLTQFGGISAIVRHLLQLGHELGKSSFLPDQRLPILPVDVQATRCEGSAEDHGLGILGDVLEAADADDATTKTTDVDAALGIDLGEGEEGQIEAATIVEVELVGLIDDGVVVHGGSGIDTGCRGAADQTLLVAQHNLVEETLFGGNIGDASGHARAEIADRTGE